MNKSDSNSRRNFLKKLAMGIGSTSLLATQAKFQLMQSAMAASSDIGSSSPAKSLVCVFLYGGNDSFNMLVPYNTSSYNQYARDRTIMAIPRHQLLPLKGNQQAFHPSMTGLRDLYNQDKLAVVANTGSLIQPVTKTEIINETAILPSELFSHNHQQEFWQTGDTAKASTHPPGWGGRMADMLVNANSDPSIPPLFTMAGNNLWQVGQQPLSFSVDPYNGIESFHRFSENTWPPYKNSRIEAWNDILKLQNDSYIKTHMTDTYTQTTQRIGKLQGFLQSSPTFTTPINNDNHLAVQLRSVASMISAREAMGMKRQLYFVSIGGWDTHGEQLNQHAINLRVLDEALSSFYHSTVELGLEDSVTTFTTSEFGRTYTSNNDGTDHAWSGHQLVMGGDVNGGQIHGELPNVALKGPDDVDESGRFIPKYSVDQYGATLANWMGLSTSEQEEILPNLKNFSNKNLGFMKS